MLGAMSGIGKSTLALQIAENLAAPKDDGQPGIPVLFFSMEMSFAWVQAKAVSRQMQQLIRAAAATILNQFDHTVYLAGQDDATLRYVAQLANKSVDTVMKMPLDGAYVYERGKGARLMERYDPFRRPAEDMNTEKKEDGKEADIL